MQPAASFVGLSTLDILYRVDHMPGLDEKMVATRQETYAGGPATNAAITFAHLGGEACLQTAAGQHPLTAVLRAELESFHIRLVDLAEDFDGPPSISSILTCGGARSVVSANATRLPLRLESLDLEELTARPLLLVDGHHLEAAIAAARHARAHGVVTVLDGGSWKPGLEGLLEHLDIAICSADFRVPQCGAAPAEIAARLFERGVHRVAVTRGSNSVLAFAEGKSFEVAVETTDVVDTLGAGDVFHGAFAYAWLDTGSKFRQALEFAAEKASASCRGFGARAWMGAQTR